MGLKETNFIGLFFPFERLLQIKKDFCTLVQLIFDLLEDVMKKGIHPEYKKAIVTCICGNTFETRSTIGNIHLEICSNCHPYYTGKQKLVDSAGRVERYNRKYAKKAAAVAPAA